MDGSVTIPMPRKRRTLISQLRTNFGSLALDTSLLVALVWTNMAVLALGLWGILYPWGFFLKWISQPARAIDRAFPTLSTNLAPLAFLPVALAYFCGSRKSLGAAPARVLFSPKLRRNRKKRLIVFFLAFSLVCQVSTIYYFELH